MNAKYACAIAILLANVSGCTDSAFNSSGAHESEDDNAKEPSGEPDDAAAEGELGTDAPVWINGSYLTCALQSLNNESGIDVICGYVDDKFKSTNIDKALSCEWGLKDAAGVDLEMTYKKPGGQSCVLGFRVATEAFPTAQVTVAVTNGTMSKDVSSSLKAALGEVGAAISICLEKGALTNECLLDSTENSASIGNFGSLMDGFGASPEKGVQMGAEPSVPKAQGSVPARLFLSSKLYRGNLGGFAGADAECTTMATGKGLMGNWKAVLSDSSASLRKRIKLPNGAINHPQDQNHFAPFAMSDFQLWLSGKAITPAVFDENLIVVTGEVWTGSTQKGLAQTATCENWTSDAPTATGTAGNGAAAETWLDAGHGPVDCSQLKHIYCVNSQP